MKQRLLIVHRTIIIYCNYLRQISTCLSAFIKPLQVKPLISQLEFYMIVSNN
jgi:hypothetical protein